MSIDLIRKKLDCYIAYQYGNTNKRHNSILL